MGQAKSLSEQMRENKRIINRAIREMDRERMTLEREQKKLEAEIKKMAKEGQMNAVKIMARDLVRTRQHISKFHVMTSNLKGLSLKMQTMKSTHEMGQAMGKMTKAMKQMNKQMNIASLTKMMAEFEKESEKADMTQEMMDDVMDDVFASDVAEEDAIVQKVLDDLGVEVANGLASAPTSKVSGKEAVVESNEAEASVTSDLEARLENLRRNG